MNSKLLLYHWLTAICGLLMITSSYGQVGTPLTFSNKGILKTFPFHHFEVEPTFSLTGTTIPAYDPETSRKLILASISATLDSLDQPNSTLKALYIAMWGGPQYEIIHQDLKTLHEYFFTSNPRNPGAICHFLPNPATILSDIANYNIEYKLKEQFDPRTQNKVINLLASDPLKQYIIAFYNQNRPWLPSEQPWNYDQEWKKFSSMKEQFYKDTAAIRKLLETTSPPTAQDDEAIKEVEQILDTLETDYLLSHIKNDRFYQQWTWLNSGNFRLNPFTTHVAVNLNYAAQFDKIVRDQLNLAQTCCNGDTSKILSLINVQGQGNKYFKINMATPVLGMKGLEDLQQAIIVANQIKVPVNNRYQGTNSGMAPMATNHLDRKWIFNFDGNDPSYPTDAWQIKAAIPENEQIILAVHNIPVKENISFVSKQAKFANQSNFQEEAGNFSVLLTPLLGIPVAPVAVATSLFKTMAAINNPLIAPVPIVAHSANYKITRSNRRVLKKTFAHRKREHRSDIYEITLPNDGTFTATIQVFKNTSNEVILRRFIYKYQEWTAVNLTPYLLRFTKAYGLKEINYKQPHATVISFIESLLQRFQAYAIVAASREPLLLRFLKNELIVNTVAAQDTARPPLKIMAKQGIPVLRTYLSNFKQPAQMALTYQITLTKVKTGQDGKLSSVDTVVVDTTFKVGKKHYFDVSAGLVVTLNGYTQNKAIVNGGAISFKAEDQQVQAVAGINFYPWQSFNPEDNFLGIKNRRVLRGRPLNRLSIFAGLGIPNPLNNYYLGAAYDIVPGLKLNFGAHIIKYTKYRINNNVITEEHAGVNTAGPYISLNIDASVFKTLISSFK